MYFQLLDDISPVFQLSCGQFFWMGICALCGMLYNRKPLQIIQKSNAVQMGMFTLTSILLGILTFIASVHIPVGSLNAILILSFMLASFIFTLLKTRFTKEEYKMIAIIIDVTTIILMSVAVILLVQPTELFVGSKSFHENSTTYKSLCNNNRFANVNTSNDTANHSDATETYISTRWIGYLCAFLSGFMNLATVAFGKSLHKDVNINNAIFWLSLCSVTFCLVIVSFQHGFTFPQKTLCLVLLLLHGLTGGMTYYFFYLGMCYISCVDVAVIGGCILPFLFIFQFAFLREISPTPTNDMAIIAAVAILVIVIGKPLLQGFLVKKGYMRLTE